jgi:hypothetical protein
MDRSKRNKKIFIFQFCQKGFGFIQQFIIFVLSFVSLSCNTYLQNVKKDSLDIFTLEVHDKTYGINTRISFLQVGLIYQSQESNNIGIKNGMFGNLDHHNFNLLFLGSERFTGKKILENSQYEEEIKKIHAKKDANLQEIPEELKQYYINNQSLKQENQQNLPRNKFYDVYLPFGTKKSLKESTPVLKKRNNFANSSFYTDIQLRVGLYYGFTIGFNPGELLDFLASLVGLDLYNDNER